MVVAFLDLLGFSQLLKTNQNNALSNFLFFNEMAKCKILDYKKMSNYEMEESLKNFVNNTSITSFNNMISISDSLIVSAKDVDINLFIKQLSNFVASAYINTVNEFGLPHNIGESKDYEYLTTSQEEVTNTYKNKIPVMFRGGISFGNDVAFVDVPFIVNTDLKTSISVTGKTYLEAVKLEGSGKGPRLFCDESVVNAVNDKTKKLIKVVDKEKGIYEIVWTIEGCEATGCCSSNKWENVRDRISHKMLPSAINLYQYYRNNEKLEPQYKELLKLVCEGIVKYAKDECDRANDAIDLINKQFKINEQLLLGDFLK